MVATANGSGKPVTKFSGCLMLWGALGIKRTEDIAFVESIGCDDCVVVSEQVEREEARVGLYLSLEGWAGCSDDDAVSQSRFERNVIPGRSLEVWMFWWDGSMGREKMKLTQKARFHFGDSS